MENNNVLHATSDEQLEAAKKIRDHLIKEGEPRLLAIFNAGKIIALSEIPSGIEPPIMENNNRQGCRWVKASDFEFEEGIRYFYKIPDNGSMGICKKEGGDLLYINYGDWEK